MTEVKSLNFNMSVSSMEYIPEGEILVITYGRSIAFHSAVRYVQEMPSFFLLVIKDNLGYLKIGRHVQKVFNSFKGRFGLCYIIGREMFPYSLLCFLRIWHTLIRRIIGITFQIFRTFIGKI